MFCLETLREQILNSNEYATFKRLRFDSTLYPKTRATRISTMPDRISIMMDSMITAVDEGFSYDGIVSIPKIGLEDVWYRPVLAGWLDEGLVRLQLLLPTMITNDGSCDSGAISDHNSNHFGCGSQVTRFSLKFLSQRRADMDHA